MEFLNRQEEMQRLDAATKQPGGFAVVWGRRRVGKSRLLIEWSQCHDGLYAVADQSAPAVQRRYLATAVAGRFKGFDEVEYPDWRTLGPDAELARRLAALELETEVVLKIRARDPLEGLRPHRAEFLRQRASPRQELLGDRPGAFEDGRPRRIRRRQVHKYRHLIRREVPL